MGHLNTEKPPRNVGHDFQNAQWFWEPQFLVCLIGDNFKGWKVVNTQAEILAPLKSIGNGQWPRRGHNLTASLWKPVHFRVSPIGPPKWQVTYEKHWPFCVVCKKSSSVRSIHSWLEIQEFSVFTGQKKSRNLFQLKAPIARIPYLWAHWYAKLMLWWSFGNPGWKK